jgi:outer membrane protein assembly factor BamE (lipoprotein component of BamABCDE complex)
MKMKLLLKLGLILILIAILVAGAIFYFTRGRLSEKRINQPSEEQINQLSFGMSEAEVVSLLGKPDDVAGRNPRNIKGIQTGMSVAYYFELDNDTTLNIIFWGKLASVAVTFKDQNAIWIMDYRDPRGTTPLIDIETRTFGRTQPRFEISDANTQVSTETLNQIEREMSQAELESILGKASSITEDGENLYRLSENYDIVIQFVTDGLSSVDLVDCEGNFIQLLLTEYDPPSTRLVYDPISASFSKEYGPVYFDQTSGSFQPEVLNQIQSGMSQEDVIAVLGLPDEESEEYWYIYQISENRRLSISFDSSLYDVTLQEEQDSSVFNTHFSWDLLDDRDPIGTRIIYDSESGEFSKIFQE